MLFIIQGISTAVIAEVSFSPVSKTGTNTE